MEKNEGRGWTLVAVFLLIGLLCVIMAGNLAIRFAPRWTLQADMRSRLNPDGAYYTPQPGYVIPPLDPDILTPPVWINFFLTPGASIPTRIPNAPITPPNTLAPTLIPLTDAPTITSTSTGTFVLFTPTKLSTPSLPPIKTATIASIGTLTPNRTPTTAPSSTATSTPTNTPRPEADLQITINDNATAFEANAPVQYTIVVSNPAGPAAATGAAVNSNFSVNLVNIGWNCTGTGGASCTSSGTGNIADVVQLPPGTSVTYWVTAQVIGSPTSSLESMVTVNAPPGITDTYPANNSAADTDTLIFTDPPPGEIGSSPDGNVYNLLAGGSLTLTLDVPIDVHGHDKYDLIYYELPMGSGILLDWVTVEISDGRNWYTVFNWGNNIADSNTNMDFNILSPPVIAPFPPPEEPDQRDILSTELYPFPGTGIAIDLDNFVPPGSYSYIRFSCPSSINGITDTDGRMEIDAIEVLN